MNFSIEFLKEDYAGLKTLNMSAEKTTMKEISSTKKSEVTPSSKEYKMTKIVGWLKVTEAITVSAESLPYKLILNSVKIKSRLHSLLEDNLLQGSYTNPS